MMLLSIASHAFVTGPVPHHHAVRAQPLAASVVMQADKVTVSRRNLAVGAAALTTLSQQPLTACAGEVKSVVVAGATGQTGRRCVERLLKMGGVSVVGGVRDPTKAAKKRAAIDASAVDLRAIDVEKSSVADMTAALKGAD